MMKEMQHIQKKTYELREGRKKKDIVNISKVEISSLLSVFGGRRLNGGNSGDNKEVIECYLLIPSYHTEYVEFICNNWKSLNSVINRDLDVVLVGYDKNGKFNSDLYVRFIEEIEKSIKLKRVDSPQLLVCKMKCVGAKLEFTNKACWTSIEDILENRDLEMLKVLIRKLISIRKKTNTASGFIWRTKKEFPATKESLSGGEKKEIVVMALEIAGTIIKLFIT